MDHREKQVGLKEPVPGMILRIAESIIVQPAVRVDSSFQDRAGSTEYHY